MSVAGVSFNSNSLITYIFQLSSHTDTLCSLINVNSFNTGPFFTMDLALLLSHIAF